MMRYSKQISTGLVIETQSKGNPSNPADLEVLKNNAISKGIPETDIELGYITSGESKDMMLADEAKRDTADPMRKWEKDIALEQMNRNREDHIKDVKNGVADSPAEQVLYDKKIKIRGERP